MARNGLPGISSPLPADVRQFLERVRESLTAGGVVTRAELVAAGIVTPDGYGNLLAGAPAQASRLPPPAPEGVAATGAMTHILVEWDAPAYANHAYAEVWASGTDDLGEAVPVGTTPANLFPHPVGAGQARYYWVRFVSKADIPGPYNAVAGVHAATSNDPAWLLAVLTEQISEDQLVAALNTRLNLIDTSVMTTGLPGGLVGLGEYHRAQLYQLGLTLDASAETILATASKINGIETRLTDAGIVTNPDTGQVYIYGLEEYKTANNARVSAAEVRLDGAEANISLKASVDYVDEAIAAAVFDPSQVADLTNLYARMTAAEVAIDGAEASILLKASQVEVDGHESRITVAEGTLTTLAGQIALKASTATVDAINTRLNTAESTLNTIDVAEIVQQATSTRQLRKAQDAQAEALLNSLFFANRELTDPAGVVALAKNELRAYTDDGLTAEATARLVLAAAVDVNAAAILAESTVRADAVSALSSSITTLQSTVGGHTAALSVQAESINGISALYAVKMDVNGVMSGFGLTSDLAAGGAVSSKFIAAVDEFAVIAPGRTAGTLASVPFAVLTTTQTINGVTFSPGVYIDGGSINAGTVGNLQIADAAIDNAKIINLSAAKLTAGDVAADRLTANVIAAVQAVVSNLSAIRSNLGTVTIDSSGYLRGGASGYLTGAGFWMGYHSGAYKFHIGDPAGDRLAWTGTSLDIKGTLNGCDGTFSGELVAGSINIAGLFVVTEEGQMTVKSAATGARVEMTNSVIKVFDAANNLRVQIGDLAA